MSKKTALGLKVHRQRRALRWVEFTMLDNINSSVTLFNRATRLFAKINRGMLSDDAVEIKISCELCCSCYLAWICHNLCVCALVVAVVLR